MDRWLLLISRLVHGLFNGLFILVKKKQEQIPQELKAK